MDHSNPDWDKRIGRRLKLRDLHILSTVVQWGSMAKAASHLAMSQPAVSESVANLEAALRVRLLDRSTRGIEATRYAHALLKRGHVVFDELGQAIKDIEHMADPTAGQIRVASGEMLDAGLLPAAIERLTRRHPQIIVDVVRAGSPATLEFRELRERAVDLVLSRIPRGFTADDLELEVLFHDPNRVVVGGRSPWAKRRKLTLADLAQEPWIFPATQVTRSLIAEAFGAQGLPVPREKVSAGSILLRNQLLASGRFVTVLPDSVLRYNAKQWSLKVLPVDLGVTPRSVAIVTLKNRTLSPVVAQFLDDVRAVAKAMSAPSAPPSARGRKTAQPSN
jgi:DNA-binding transcriptional LysR family regulator